MDTITLVIVVCLLILVLALEIQISAISKKLDEFLKRTGRL
jgi:hypothetical protein